MQPEEGEYGVATDAYPEGGVRSPAPGENTFSYEALPEIKRRVAALPAL